MYKHVLVATDGSEIAGRAVSQATELAQKLRARLLIVTITEPFHILSLDIGQLENTRPEYNRHMAEHAQAVLASAAKVASDAGVECQISIAQPSTPMLPFSKSPMIVSAISSSLVPMDEAGFRPFSWGAPP